MSVAAIDNIDIAKGHGQGTMQGTIQEAKAGHGRISVDLRDDSNSMMKEVHPDTPTEEELQTLRRVSGKIPMVAWTIAFCELCERFSYYGTSIVYTNFMAWPLPEGSNTGAGGTDGQSGALGRGTQFATSLSLFNQFWAYVMPLLGAYVADAHLGRFKTIHLAILISIIAHVVLVAAAAPAVIVKQQSSTAAFIIGLICLGIGTGMFKANVSPLLAEQVKDTRMRVTTLPKTGERVIVDPAVTNTRIFLYFYMCINVGSLVGQITMVYAEKYVGFWLAWMLPTILFLAAPVVLFIFRKKYVHTPPAGSVLSKFFHMFFYAMKGHWLAPKSFTWDVARPSNVSPEARPKWMTYDDAWVDEVRRGLKACKVFCFLPLFHLAYNQMTNNLTSQAAVMELHGVPNDLIQNLNPISIVIMIPILDHLVYPGFRKIGFNFTPIKRMCVGFFFGSGAMVAATVMQYYIYKLSPCGRYPSDTDCIAENGPAPINVWAQLIPYVLIGISELFTNVTSYEYAFSKAPSNMKSLVMSVNLFMSAFASAIQQAWAPLTADPLLEWNYGSVAVLAAAGGVAFWFCFRKLDKEEDKWNSIEKSAYSGKNNDVSGRRQSSVAHTTEVANEKV